MSEPDRLQLSGMVFFGHHGALPAERELGQDFAVDVTVEGDWSAARRWDRLQDALDYRVIREAVRDVVEGPPMNLLEGVADRVARRLARLPRVSRVRVAIGKHPPLPGSFQTFRVVVVVDAEPASEEAPRQ